MTRPKPPKRKTMMTKHSKAPWHLHTEDDDHPELGAPINGDKNTVVGICQFHMLECENGVIQEERSSEQIANIALIAAAPRLLAAAKQLLGLVQLGTDMTVSGAGLEAMGEMDQAINEAEDRGWIECLEDES